MEHLSRAPTADGQLEALSALASELGPFFFSVLFLLVVTTTARHWYKETCTRQPPSEHDERIAMRRYFWMAALVGIGLSFVAVGWFVYKNFGSAHAYHVVFVDLKPNQFINLRDEPCYARHPPDSAYSERELKKFECVIVRERPFRKGDVYTIHYREIDSLSGSGKVPLGESVDVVVSAPERRVLRFKLMNKGGHLAVHQLIG